MNMVRIIPARTCPNCGHSEFIIHQSTSMVYLTDRDGEIKDQLQDREVIKGICLRCKREYDMLQTINGFIPMTQLRKLLYQNTHHYEVEEQNDTIPNPMQKEIKNDSK